MTAAAEDLKEAAQKIGADGVLWAQFNRPVSDAPAGVMSLLVDSSRNSRVATDTVGSLGRLTVHEFSGRTWANTRVWSAATRD